MMDNLTQKLANARYNKAKALLDDKTYSENNEYNITIRPGYIVRLLKGLGNY